MISAGIPKRLQDADSAFHPEGKTINDVIEEMDLPIIQDCHSGSCKCQVTNGRVESNSTVVFSDEDMSQGYVLACKTHMKSDIGLSLV